MSRLRAWTEYLPIRTAQLLLRLLPRRFALGLGRGIGLLAYLADRRHRRVAHENIAACLPEGSEQATRRRIARRCFSHFGLVGVECLLMPFRTRDEIRRLAVWEGLEHLKAAHGKGKGVFVISGHLGNWEMVALLQGWSDLPMAMVTRPLDNPLLEDLLAGGRSRSGNRIVHKRRAVRGMMEALRNGWCVALVIDQDFPKSERVFVDFFGRPAATAPTLGVLALRTGAPIVPVVSEALPDGRYRIRYLPPVEPRLSGDRESDILDIMSRCTSILENEIRRNPEQWLWMHRRWKTRPKPPKPPAEAAEETPCPRADAGRSSSIGTAP
jgi:KDO2-lipid IV(A) lauroyltransferase